MRAGNIKVSSLAAKKQLQYHPKKAGYLVYGNEKIQTKAKLKVQMDPVLIGKMIVKEKHQERYL